MAPPFTTPLFAYILNFRSIDENTTDMMVLFRAAVLNKSQPIVAEIIQGFFDDSSVNVKTPLYIQTRDRTF